MVDVDPGIRIIMECVYRYSDLGTSGKLNVVNGAGTNTRSRYEIKRWIKTLRLAYYTVQILYVRVQHSSFCPVLKCIKFVRGVASQCLLVSPDSQVDKALAAGTNNFLKVYFIVYKK